MLESDSRMLSLRACFVFFPVLRVAGPTDFETYPLPLPLGHRLLAVTFKGYHRTWTPKTGVRVSGCKLFRSVQEGTKGKQLKTFDTETDSFVVSTISFKLTRRPASRLPGHNPSVRRSWW